MSYALRSALAAAAVLAISAGAASAADFSGKKAGDVVVRARGIATVPQEKADIKAGGVDTGLDAKVGNEYTLELDGTYFVTDNIAVELIAGTTNHKVKASNGLDLGSVWLLPPTVTAQYHFLPKSQFSPYVGAGLNYTFFYGEKSGQANSIHYKDNFGFALQAGADYYIDNKWSVNLDVKKLFLTTDVSVNNGALTTKAHLDPWIVGLGVGYKF